MRTSILLILVLTNTTWAQEAKPSAQSDLPKGLQDEIRAMPLSQLMQYMADAQASLGRSGRQVIKRESVATQLLEKAQRTLDEFESNRDGFGDSVTKVVAFWKSPTTQSKVKNLQKIKDDDQLDKEFELLLNAEGVGFKDFQSFVIFVEAKSTVPRLKKVLAKLRSMRKGEVPVLKEMQEGTGTSLGDKTKILEGFVDQREASRSTDKEDGKPTSRGFRGLIERLQGVEFE